MKWILVTMIAGNSPEPITGTRPTDVECTIFDYIHFTRHTEKQLDTLRNLTVDSYSLIIAEAIQYSYKYLLEKYAT